VTLDERRICIEGKGAVGTKNSYCCSGIPCDGDHLAICCTTIIFVRVRRSYAIKSRKGCEVHVLERMLNGASAASSSKLSHHSGSLPHVLEFFNHVYVRIFPFNYYFAVFGKTFLFNYSVYFFPVVEPQKMIIRRRP